MTLTGHGQSHIKAKVHLTLQIVHAQQPSDRARFSTITA